MVLPLRHIELKEITELIENSRETSFFAARTPTRRRLACFSVVEQHLEALCRPTGFQPIHHVPFDW
jgi:hypothetical protein